jgi:hypothetical protein
MISSRFARGVHIYVSLMPSFQSVLQGARTHQMLTVFKQIVFGADAEYLLSAFGRKGQDVKLHNNDGMLQRS